jgi:hypothetical protein
MVGLGYTRDGIEAADTPGLTYLQDEEVELA